MGKKIQFCVLLSLTALLLFSCATSDFSKRTSRETIKNRAAAVKIINVAQSPNFYRPWEMEGYETYSGTGAVLEDGTIITNAHVVADSRYLTVLKENDPKRYEAEILYIGHECDLALLKVRDEDFYQNISYLQLSDIIPDLNSVVTTYGYPMGGERISITKGVVSRIEIDTYVHQWKSAFLQVQTDAAINPGNSGGPVIQDGKIVGIAFQGLSSGENIGYMIPTVVIRHFLDDVKDGVFDGFPDLGIIWSNLENEDFCRYIGMPEGREGVYITSVLPGGSADGFLKKRDAIISVDGIEIAADGSIPFEQGRILFSYLIDAKQCNEKLTLEILRDKKLVTVSFPVEQSPIRIPNYYTYDKKPRYLIYGGIVFQKLSLEYLELWDEWWKKADSLLLYYFGYHINDAVKPEREEFVVVNDVLPDQSNMYITDITDRVVDTINGIPILKLEDIPGAIKKGEKGFIVITFDDFPRPIVLKYDESEEAQERILRKYGIVKDRELNR